MAEVFISYSTQDEKLARFVYEHLQREGISTFLASVSLKPGEQWSSEIISNFKSTQWVILLASKSACQSAFVQQEMGGAVFGDKKIIPIVWDIPPEDLPGWISNYQAVNLAGATTIDQIAASIADIAKKIKSDKYQGLIIIGAILLGLIMLKG